LLLDINMPGLNGVELAAYLRQHAPQLAVVFVTAEAQHALAAFDVAAVDYILKPVRASRLLAALHKVAAKLGALTALQSLESLESEQLQASLNTPAAPAMLSVHDGNTPISLPLAQVLYFKADQKTTTVRTAQRHYTCGLSLAELEIWLATQPPAFVRIHRNALLRRAAALGLGQGLGLESGSSSGSGSGSGSGPETSTPVNHDSSVAVQGIAERLQVSRRMLANLKTGG
jgi:two-component system, LytTR family, response regulator AlgR